MSPSFQLVPDVGYASTRGETRSTYLALLGVGLEAQLLETVGFVRYAPRFVIGSRGGELAYGFRHGVELSVLTMLGIELSHQLLRSDNLTQQEIIVVGTVEPLIALAGIAWFAFDHLTTPHESIPVPTQTAILDRV